MSRAGSVKKDASGRWYFVVDLAPAGAPRKQVRKRGFRTKDAAQDALDKVKEANRRGEYVEPDRVTFGQYLTDWLATLPTKGRRPSTVDGYRRQVERHVQSRELADVPLQAVTAVDLDRLYAELLTSGRTRGRDKGKGLSARSVRYLHSILSAALADAERTNLVPRNVARKASPPPAKAAKAPEATVWEPSELRAFLERTAGHHHGALFHVAAMTGMRRGELCGLRWADVDFDGGTIKVRQAITVAGGRPVEGGVKSERSRRTIGIDPGTVAVLKAHRKHQLEERMLVGAGYEDRGLVFAMPDGRPWNPDVITRAFDRQVKASPLPRIRFHDLRHSHASHLLRAGVGVKVVSARLGHSSAAFTLDVYAHLLADDQAEAAAAVAALVDGAL